MSTPPYRSWSMASVLWTVPREALLVEKWVLRFLQFSVQPSRSQCKRSPTQRRNSQRCRNFELLDPRHILGSMWQGVAGYRTGPGPAERRPRVHCSRKACALQQKNVCTAAEKCVHCSSDNNLLQASVSSTLCLVTCS